MRKRFISSRYFLCLLFINLAFTGIVASQNHELKPGSIFREYSFNKVVTPYIGPFAHKDSFFVDLDINDLSEAIGAEIALQYWGGHVGTSNQTFRVNDSPKFNFPQPNTPGNPYCFFRTVLGNPPVQLPINLIKKGNNRFTFFCGPQVCHSYNWALYWLYSFTVRIYYGDIKDCVKGTVKKVGKNDSATNLTEFITDTDNPAKVASVEYIGFYEDYDLDGDGNPAGWHYILENGLWKEIIGKQLLPPYKSGWNNSWVPQQDGVIKVIAKINSENGISFLTTPVELKGLKQIHSRVKMYNTVNLIDNFGARAGERKECKIPVNDDLTHAISAYVVLSSWSGASEDGAVHEMGINGKVLAESPGILHDWKLLKIPVPLDYLKRGDNLFFIHSETEGHAFEINYPGPSILIRYKGE